MQPALAAKVVDTCKRITARPPVLSHRAISLIPHRLYRPGGWGGFNLVTQKVRLRSIYGEESLSPARLFGAWKLPKGYRAGAITRLKLCKFLNQRPLRPYYKTRR
jgi:hypothetical protein